MPDPSDKQISQWLSLVAKGYGKWGAALEVGLAPVSLRRRLAEDPALAEEVRTAEELALEPTLQAMRSIASDPEHPQMMQAAKQLLNARHEDFTPKPVQKEEPIVRIDVATDQVLSLIQAIEARNKELNPGGSPPIEDESDDVIDVMPVDDGVAD